MSQINDSKLLTPNSELPQGWRWAKLGDICELTMGQSPPGDTYTDKPEGLPFFQGKADFAEYFPTVRIWCTQPIKVAEDGDILISVRAPVGPVNMSNLKCCIGRGLTSIRCKDNAINWFIFWYLHSIEKQIASLGSGSTFGAITRDDLVNLEIPLLPLGEQMRIAAKIQELMQEVERARTACEKQLEAAKALPAGYLREVFGSEESKKWERKRLGEVCKIVSKGTTPTTYGHSFVSSGVPFLRAEDITGGPVDFSSVTFHITKKTHDFLARSKLYPGDLLITIAGTLGRVGYVPDAAPQANCNQAVAFARVDPTKAYVKFLCYVLQVHEILAPFTELKAGGTIQNLNLEQVRRIEIPLPDLSTQWHIVDELKEKMPQVENLRSAIQNQQSALGALPQAILRKAFRGEL